MMDFTKSKISLVFDIGRVDDTSMAMTFIYGKDCDQICDLPHGRYVHEIDIEFPSRLSIQLSGKQPNDTKVDSEGKIIADKYIKLESILVDGYPTDPNWACRFLTLYPEDRDPVVTNYWGFNGTVDIDFDSDNAFVWLVRTRRP